MGAAAALAGGWRGWRAGCLIVVAILVVIATIQIAIAGIPFDLDGTIIDENGALLPSGNLTAIINGSVVASTTTAADGTYVLFFDSVEIGEIISFRYEGYNATENYTTEGRRAWSMDLRIPFPPTINNVTLNTTSLYTGQPILVTVNATDSVGVTNVSANGTLLSAMGGNIWQGSITALRGTHAVNVSASDAAGNVAWNNSTSYTASNAIVASIDKSVYLPGENITLTGRVYSDYGDGEARIVVLNSSADSVYDNVVNVTGGSMLEIFGAPLDAGDYRLAVSFVDMSIAIDFNIDATPPASITGLTNNSYAQTYINWTWTDPADADFDKVMVYLNGSFRTNVTNGTQFYNATGLSADTEYTISTKTVDAVGNINATWQNRTARTAPPPDTTSPSIQSLRIANITNTTAVISWTTNEAAQSILKYGATSGSYPSNITGSSPATSHTFALTGLSPSTKYYFKANSTDASGNSAESVEYNFTTASSFIERTITTIGNRTNVTSGSGNTTLNITTNRSVANAPINITEHAANPVSSNSVSRGGSIVSLPSINKFVEIEAGSELKSNISVITIRINYSGSDLTGIDESTLRLFWWNETASAWEALSDSGVDTANKIVWGNVTHLSLFGAFGNSSSSTSSSSSSGGGGGGGGVVEAVGFQARMPRTYF